MATEERSTCVLCRTDLGDAIHVQLPDEDRCFAVVVRCSRDSSGRRRWHVEELALMDLGLEAVGGGTVVPFPRR